ATPSTWMLDTDAAVAPARPPTGMPNNFAAATRSGASRWSTSDAVGAIGTAGASNCSAQYAIVAQSMANIASEAASNVQRREATVRLKRSGEGEEGAGLHWYHSPSRQGSVQEYRCTVRRAIGGRGRASAASRCARSWW